MISVRPQPTSSALSVPNRAKARLWFCLPATQKRWACIWPRSPTRSNLAHAVLLLDQAGWHLSTQLIVPPNITIIALPPKSPELNPMENIWQFVRDNWLSNRIFASSEDLLEHCCEAWNRLIEQPWRIMSIGLRKWAHGC
jgi:transposase